MHWTINKSEDAIPNQNDAYGGSCPDRGSPDFVCCSPTEGRCGQVEITPPVGHQLSGQASRTGPSTGTLDPVFARVLVLQHGSESLALVTLDPIYLQPDSNRWEPKALESIFQAIVRASEGALPCRLGTGKGLFYTGHNRVMLVGDRHTGPSKTCILTAPLDPVVQILRVDHVGVVSRPGDQVEWNRNA